MIKIREYRNHFVEKLSIIYDKDEAESIFYLILEQSYSLKRIDLALNPDITFDEKSIENWNKILERLLTNEPVQYILAKSHFMEMEFFVDQNVLIPRPETEELVQMIINDYAGNQSNLKILDIGTGSGAIAISLAKYFPNAKVSAVDISEGALAVAKKNASDNKVEVNFAKADILKTENLNEDFDIIVSNPPYVRILEKQEMRANVIDHEPDTALFVNDNDALIFYKKISELAKNHLSANGKLYFEINQYLAKETKDLILQNGFTKVEIFKDIFGNDRMIKASK